jgi:aspartate 1-decarboxylase
LSIDENLLEKAGIFPNERVHVYNINNGKRFETYAIKAKRGSGEIGLNGAAARLGQVGDLIIIVTYCYLSQNEIQSHNPNVIILDEENRIGYTAEE